MDEERAFNELAEIFSDYDLQNQPLMAMQVRAILKKLAAHNT